MNQLFFVEEKMSPTQIDELDALEDRVAKLEALVGKSDKIAPAQVNTNETNKRCFF